MYAVRMMGMSGGNVEVDSGRVMMVRVKPARRRAAVMGAPKLPVACIQELSSS